MSLFGKHREKPAAGLATVAAFFLALLLGGCELIVGVPIALTIAAVCDTCVNSPLSYEETYEENLEKAKQEVLERAKDGDPKAQYLAAIDTPDPDERWMWMCRSAMQNHPNAQQLIANWYDSNTKHLLWEFPIPRPDNVKALTWYTLAVSNGYQDFSQKRDQVAASLTPDQIAEAERMVAEWKPDPGWCEKAAGDAMAAEPH